MHSAGGPAVQVTNHGGYAAFESLDGKFLYYTKYQAVPGIWRIPTSGGEETEGAHGRNARYHTEGPAP